MMVPSVHFRRIFATFVVTPLRWLGCSYLRTGRFISIRTLIVWAGVCACMICMIYTMLSKDAHTMMKCTTLAAVGTQGCSKFYVLYAHSDNLRRKYEYLLNVFLQCEKHRREASALRAWQGLMNFLVRAFVLIMIINMLGFSLSPIYVYCVKGIVEVPLPMAVPFVDDSTTAGFVVTTVFQLSCLGVATIGTIGFDLTMLLLLIGVCMIIDIMVLKLILLSDGLRDGGPDTPDRRETRAFVHNFIRLTIEFSTQLKSLSTMFYATFIFEIGLDSLGMCLILFVLTQLTWVPLYAYFMCFIIKAFFACMMGTMISIYCDKLYDAIEMFPHYKLALCDRWKYTFVMQRLQNPTLLMCGTMKMNMELFVAVMKNAYTVAMMLNGLSE